jgi:hypothetical protein
VAKANNHSGGERSRARIVVLDLDLAAGDMGQLAGAILSAIKPPLPVAPALPTAPPKALPYHQNGDQPGLFDQQIEAEEQEELRQQHEVPVAPAKPQNGSKKRGKLRTPVILSDLEFTSGSKPLDAYIAEQAPTEHSKRYLAITHWLKEYRSIAEVGADHIYTCYRYLSLSVPDDVLSIFRALKKQGWVEATSERGTFRINHIGEKQLLNAVKNKE